MNQRVSVAGLIESDQKILVVRRSQNEGFLPGIFELPGGKLEFGETLENAVHREIKEETNLEVSIKSLVDARSYLSKGDSQHNIELIYLVVPAVRGQEVKLGKEHDLHLWINREDIESLTLPSNDPIRNIIEEFFSRKTG